MKIVSKVVMYEYLYLEKIIGNTLNSLERMTDILDLPKCPGKQIM